MVVSEAGGKRVQGVIVETEAYLGWDDPASHAYHGRRYPDSARPSCSGPCGSPTAKRSRPNGEAGPIIER